MLSNNRQGVLLIINNTANLELREGGGAACGARRGRLWRRTEKERQLATWRIRRRCSAWW